MSPRGCPSARRSAELLQGDGELHSRRRGRLGGLSGGSTRRSRERPDGGDDQLPRRMADAVSATFGLTAGSSERAVGPVSYIPIASPFATRSLVRGFRSSGGTGLEPA